MVFGVRSQFRCKRSAAPEGRAAGSGNLCSDPENARSRIAFLIARARTLQSPDAALSPRRATHFLLLRQEKVSKEKATLLSASLRCATGSLWCSVQPGSRSNSPAAQTIAGPDPSGPALLGADRRGWVRNSGSIEPASRAQCRYFFNSCLREYSLGYRPKLERNGICQFQLHQRRRCPYQETTCAGFAGVLLL